MADIRKKIFLEDEAAWRDYFIQTPKGQASKQASLIIQKLAKVSNVGIFWLTNEKLSVKRASTGVQFNLLQISLTPFLL